MRFIVHLQDAPPVGHAFANGVYKHVRDACWRIKRTAIPCSDDAMARLRWHRRNKDAGMREVEDGAAPGKWEA